MYTTTFVKHLQSWMRVTDPLPQCIKCNVFVSQQALNSLHTTTEICRRGEERKRHRLDTEEARAGENKSLKTYGKTLGSVSSFKYLGRVLSASDNN